MSQIKTVYITTKVVVELPDDIEVDDFVSELDYSFTSDDNNVIIAATEIVDYTLERGY